MLWRILSESESVPSIEELKEDLLDSLDYAKVDEELEAVYVAMTDGTRFMNREFSTEQMKIIFALARAENKTLEQVMIETILEQEGLL